MLVLLGLLVAATSLLPLGFVVVETAKLGSAEVWDLLTRPRFDDLFWNTTRLLVGGVALSALLGVSAAWLVVRTDLAEGVDMVRGSVEFLRAQGRRVFFDAEHFFDGYRSDPGFAMAVLAAAEEAGAERLVLCDTNGGMLPFEIDRIVREVRAQASVPLGIHVHNDAGCAVANSLVAVEAGVQQVQGFGCCRCFVK